MGESVCVYCEGCDMRKVRKTFLFDRTVSAKVEGGKNVRGTDIRKTFLLDTTV